MKLTGDPENQVKCFTCNTWTSEKMLRPRMFYGREQHICVACFRSYALRDDTLVTIQLEVEEYERAKATRPSQGKHSDRTETTAEITRKVDD